MNFSKIQRRERKRFQQCKRKKDRRLKSNINNWMIDTDRVPDYDQYDDDQYEDYNNFCHNYDFKYDDFIPESGQSLFDIQKQAARMYTPKYTCECDLYVKKDECNCLGCSWFGVIGPMGIDYSIRIMSPWFDDHCSVCRCNLCVNKKKVK